MKTDTSKRIVEYIKVNRQVTAKELVEYLSISPQAVFKQLNKLVGRNIIDKIGKPPTVIYFLKKEKEEEEEIEIPSDILKIINNNYLIITPTGEKKEGIEGFSYWCRKNNLPIEKTAKEYEKTFRKYAKYKKAGFIDGSYKIKNTFDKTYIDKLFYIDFYSIERFGKTKLGWLLLYAKQSQDKQLIKEVSNILKEKIIKFINKHSIKAVGFIPPTVKRETQIMNELEKNLNINLPIINIQKIKTPVIIPQKTLNKLKDRVENAGKTFFVENKETNYNILLIDDAVGSGATINETAKKIRQGNIFKGKIYGLAITGSFKGFDVISEV